SDYMSAGVPAIVTRVGDVAELVERNRLGWVAEPDATSLASAIVEAVEATDREERGAAGRALADGELSWRCVAGRLDTFYTSAMNDWKAAAGTARSAATRRMACSTCCSRTHAGSSSSRCPRARTRACSRSCSAATGWRRLHLRRSRRAGRELG